jgi:lysophospholipase L1-like esterase
MKPKLTSILLVMLATVALQVGGLASEPLSDAEKKRLSDAEVAVRRSPVLREETAIFNEIRKEYQIDRQKFPNDRDPAVSKKYRQALAVFQNAVQKAMRESDPSVAILLDRQAELAKSGLKQANEGETLADTDSSRNHAMLPVQDDVGLPRVLLIGDSISIGYTLQVREQLQGKANVHRIPQNGGATDTGLEKIASWLGDGNWDVIHFNFGLHDAKFASETTQRASREQYVENLQTLIDKMQATGARLIFATTTPVPNKGELTPTRKFDSIEERNRLAVQLMDKNGVAIDDLYAAMLPHQKKLGRANDVHYQPEGYDLLAKSVAKSIEAELGKLRKNAKPKKANNKALLHDERFDKTAYGKIPNGWKDFFDVRPNRNWAVDGRGFLRPVLKNRIGLLVFEGHSSISSSTGSLRDGRIVAEFKKTEDEEVFFGLAGRIVDKDNYYIARFRGTEQLELLMVAEGVTNPLDLVQSANSDMRRETGSNTLRRYRHGEIWRLSLEFDGDRIETRLIDDQGIEQARLSARNNQFTEGYCGLSCTTFAAASSVHIDSSIPHEAKAESSRISKNTLSTSDYPVVRPYWKTSQLDTAPSQLATSYDLVVAGAGTGGWAAAVQAARMGSTVLLLEETDWIGGQMAAAAVTTMDEDSVWMKFPVRERGLYREFHESMALYYHTLDKDPFVAYYGWPHQFEGGYEPKVTRAVLYGFIDEVHHRGAKLDVSLQTRVTVVKKKGNTVNGATLSFADGSSRDVSCKILIDATEYGDVVPLTGARYRVGNCVSDRVDPASLVQDHTWTCVVREYPEGVPEHLRINAPPPGYEEGSGKRYRKFTNDGMILWGGAGKGIKGDRHWRVYFAWRGMADSDSSLTGFASARRHTQCGFNGGNDYPVSAATIEDVVQRRRDERDGIYKTLGALYYFQHELGVNWALAEDEGYATESNRLKMKSLELRPDLEALAVFLPQHPYVRESRRIIGIDALRAKDLTRFEDAKHVASSVAMGDYFMDLDHGKTAHAIESDLDAGDHPVGGGPFQVPFQVFIPEMIDGFLPAEKNISQSRLANGATRLQPITILTGQAAGTIAATAIRQGKQPRQVNPIAVQLALLDSGCTLIQRWYADVPWGTELWRATQLLSLYKIIDRPGAIDKDNRLPLAAKAMWGIEDLLSVRDQTAAYHRLQELLPEPRVLANPTREIPAGEFAISLAKILTVNAD